MSTTWNCRKKCKIAILLYSFLTAGVHTFVLCNLLSSGTSCYNNRFLENYLIFSNAVQPVMHSRVHFSTRFTLHSQFHFSINFIKRRNCNGYARIILYYCNVLHINCTLNFFSGSPGLNKLIPRDILISLLL